MESHNTAKPQHAPVMAQGEKRTIEYNDDVVRWFLWASVIFGVVGMLVGVIVALQIVWWPSNIGPWLSFGRLRPLHTNAVIFAFVGNMMFAGVYHSSQRLLKARLASDTLSKIHFWGWQLIIVAAAITLPLGLTQSKEYAELEWPIDIAIAAIWVVFAINFFWTVARRAERHLYVAIWFYIATIVTVAVLHIVNSLAIPVTLGKSYSLFGGAQDALVQWWYGHNAVAFFLTTPILGIMYYYVPKAAQRPVYSYRLSIVHFWALVFIYIWAGPHHLLNTALPDWAQTLGMIFSVMLWAPSWGGMINGLLTIRGAWQQLRTDPVLKFLAASVTFYGMATFEGPLLSIKGVSGLAHYTDWIIGHVHSGALGWNGFMAAGMFYWMVPRLYNRELHSKAMAEIHFYIATFGIILYVISMWISGITQGMMWRATTADGALQYPTFVETLIAQLPMYWMRLIGGTLYLVGFLMMAYNLWRTAAAGKPVVSTAEVYVPAKEPEVPWQQVVVSTPVILSLVIIVLASLTAFVNGFAGVFLTGLALVIGFLGVLAIRSAASRGHGWHRILEGRALMFTVFTVIAVLIGGLAEIIPLMMITPAQVAGATAQKPYRALELAGRDIYQREGCYTCHSQMIRPMRWETMRYGAVSELADSQYDHPFQWGSKRTGPDLAREGGRYPHLWHYRHMMDPRSITPGSNMPEYRHLASDTVDWASLSDHVRALRSIGVPYSASDVEGAPQDAEVQAQAITQELKKEGVEVAANSEMVALIAYLQRLGKPQSEVAVVDPTSPATARSASLSRSQLNP